MSEPSHKKEPTADESVESRRRSGTRRIEVTDPPSVPRAPRLPSLGWTTPADQDHVPTQPENEVPDSSSMPTLAAPAPAPRSAATVQMPDEDDDRDTIPAPGPAPES